jgi:hypothetical protein
LKQHLRHHNVILPLEVAAPAVEDEEEDEEDDEEVDASLSSANT